MRDLRRKTSTTLWKCSAKGGLYSSAALDWFHLLGRIGPMPNWNRLTWVVCVAVAIAVYFPAALWLKYSYVEPPKPAGVAIRLDRPFFELLGSEIAFAINVPSLDPLSDTMEFPKRSPFMLYENTTPLGPAHTEHADIVKYGHGRFSHWNGSGFIFSSSDGTNPKSNGRTYWAVIPPPAE